MAASASDCHPFVLYNARYRLIVPLLDADGDPVSPSSPDTELSQDCGTFADATNEATEIATSSGVVYIDLTAGELDTKSTAVRVQSTGAKTTIAVLYPVRLPVIRTGTAQAGGASSITLDSSASAITDYYVGCYVNITNNSPANAQGQARRITAYNGSTKVATVEGTYGTNPSSASTFEVLATQEWAWRLADVQSWLGTAAATPTVAGVPEVDVTHFNGTAGTFASGRPEVNTSHIAGSAVSTSSAQLGVNVVNAGGTAWASGSLTSGVFASGAITATAIAADAIGASELAADAVTEIQSGLATASALSTVDTNVSSILAAVRTVAGTSDSGSTTTMVDAARTEADDDYWNGAIILFTSGNIAGQARVITDFVAATDTITFAPATTQAVSTQNYVIIPAGDFLRPTTSGRTLDVSTGGEAGVDWANVGTPGSTVNLSATTVNLTNTVTTYTGNTPQTGDAFARLGAPAGASISADILVIDNLVDDLESRLGTPSNLGGGATIAANLVDIESQTDDIGAAGAGLTAIPWNASWDAEVQSEVDDALVVRNLDKLVLASGTAASGSTTTMVDDGLTQADADYWKGKLLVFTSGNIAGQTAWITDFNAGTDTVTFAPATTQAVSTQNYVILPAVSVWDDTLAEHLTAGSTGAALNAAGSAGDPWNTALPGAYGAGTAGKIIGDNINATISSRASQTSVDTIDDFLDTEIATIVTAVGNIETDTQDIQSRLPAALVSGRMDSSVGAMAANTLTASALATDAVTEIQAGLSTLDAAGVRTAVGLATANLDTQLDALPTATENADAILSRGVSNVQGTADTTSLCTVVLAMLESSISGTTWTIRKTDGTTFVTKTLTTAASADSITGVT